LDGVTFSKSNTMLVPWQYLASASHSMYDPSYKLINNVNHKIEKLTFISNIKYYIATKYPEPMTVLFVNFKSKSNTGK